MRAADWRPKALITLINLTYYYMTNVQPIGLLPMRFSNLFLIHVFVSIIIKINTPPLFLKIIKTLQNPLSKDLMGFKILTKCKFNVCF